MAKRKRAKLILKEGSFEIGFYDRNQDKNFEIWRHDKFYYQLTKKSRVECSFTNKKEFIPNLKIWLDYFDDVYYKESRISGGVN